MISVLLIGDCATLSIIINDFSFALDIINSCALPSPSSIKVTAIPDLVVDIVNELLLWTVFTKILDGNVPTTLSTGLLYIIGVDPTPTNVDFGL